MSAPENNVVRLPRRVVYADALIEPGRYEARAVDFETRLYFRGKAPRGVLWFQITTFGPAFESVIPAFYALRSVTGKPRRRGKFTIGFKSRLARDLAAMLGRRPPLDIVPFEDIENALFAVDVVTVERDIEQQELPEGSRYSVVRRVLERVS
jgi:hypothetical protein